MKRLLKILVMTAFLSMPILGGCQAEKPAESDNGKEKDDQGGDTDADDPANSEFVLTARNLPSFVSVALDGKSLFTMAFTYDSYNRLSTYCKKFGDDILEDATVSYKSKTEAQVDYRQMNSEILSTLSVRISSGRLVWSYSNLNNGNRYSVLLESGRWPSLYGYNVQYDGKKFTNRISYGISYGCTDGNLILKENAAEATSTAPVKTVCSSAPEHSDKVTFADLVDNANLGAFVLAGEFLPWYMKGLPGNKRLVSKIEHSTGGRTLDEYEDLEYAADADGKISAMTVKYCSGGKVLHTKEYKISY